MCEHGVDDIEVAAFVQPSHIRKAGIGEIGEGTVNVGKEFGHRFKAPANRTVLRWRGLGDWDRLEYEYLEGLIVVGLGIGEYRPAAISIRELFSRWIIGRRDRDYVYPVRT